MNHKDSILNNINSLLVFVYVAAYPAELIYMLVSNPEKLWALIALPAAGFIFVTVLRKAINAPRPYDIGGAVPKIKREGEGCSFPSRHSFSAFCIATCWAVVNPWVCAGLLVLAASVAAVRVMGGVHYLRDVVAGAALGILFGAAACYFM